MKHWNKRLGILLLVGAAAGGPLPLSAQVDVGVTQLIRESQAAAADGKLAEAEQLARKAVTLDPAHPPAWRQQGLVLLRGEKPQEASVSLQRAVAMDESDTVAWRALAQAYWQAGQQNEAVRALGTYLRLKPEDAAVWRDLAVWMTRLGRAEQAVVALNRVVELSPHDASAWRQLGTLYQRKGNAAEAATAFEKALAIRPNDPATRRDLGWILWTAGRRDDGVARLAEAIEGGVEGRERITYQVVARLSEEGADTQALAFLQRANPKAPPAALGLELAKAGRLKAAEPILRSAWKTGERSPDIGLYLAYARAVNGQFDGVAEYLAPLLASGESLSPERADLALEVLRLGGTRPEVPALVARLEPVLDKTDRYVARVTEILETSAETHRARESLEQALTLYRRVLERDPNRATWIWAVLLAEQVEGKTPHAWLDAYEARVSQPARKMGIQGLRAERLGHAEEAVPALRKSLAADANQPQLRQLLFQCLLQQGDVAAARREAEWFVRQVDAGETTLRSYAAEMLTRLGDTRAALDHWQLLHSTYPDHPFYATETANALYRLDRPDEAMDVLQSMVETTQDHRIYELMAEIASARGHTATAVEWSARGLAAAPSQGLLRYHAENLEMLGTDAPAALKSAQTFLGKDAGNVPLTLLTARMLETTEASPQPYEQFHRSLLERSPAFLPSLVALRDAATRDGRIGEAVEYARLRTEIQSGNADALRQYANSLAQHDQFRKALELLRPLADMPIERAMPVLVYQSITPAPYAGRNSVDQIAHHIQRLATDGYAFVNTFARTDASQDARRVMIVLLDPEPAVIEALDPVLQQHNARVVVAGNAAVPSLTLAGEPLRENVVSILATERWQLASGGPAPLRRQAVNEAGVLGNPLTHPLVVDGKRETTDAFAGRIDELLGASAKELGKAHERILVYPSGDFGQRSLDTTTENMAVLHDAVARHYTHALYLDDSGFHLPIAESDPLRIPARGVPSEWNADALAAYLGTGHPLARARLELARVLYWHGQHEEASAAFARAKEAGANPVDIAFNEGLNADRQGDIPTAIRKLRAAQELDAVSERIKGALERADERRRPQVQAFAHGWEDNEDRNHFRLGAYGDAFVGERLRLGAAADRNRWKTEDVGSEYGTRLGARGQAYLAPQVWLSGQLWRLDMDDLSDHWGGEGALRVPNPVLSGYLTLTAGREEIETVEALRSEIDARIYALRTYSRLFDVFDLFADLSLNDRTDGNSTTMLEGRLLYRVKEWPYAGVGWHFRLADSDFDPPEYWAPEELEQHQAHANLRGTWGRLNGTLSVDAGYARERDTDWRFVWGTRAETEFVLSHSLSLTGQLGWFEGPEYERLYGRVGLTGRF